MKIALRHIAMLTLVLLASAFGATSQAAGPAPSFVGTWVGTLDVTGVKLRIVFNIAAEANGQLSGTLDSPDQRAFGMKLDTVTQKGADVSAELKMIQGTFKGTFSKDGAEIAGMWTQLGQSLPLTLKRGEKILPARHPQAPVAPVPYQANGRSSIEAALHRA